MIKYIVDVRSLSQEEKSIISYGLKILARVDFFFFGDHGMDKIELEPHSESRLISYLLHRWPGIPFYKK